MSDRTSVSFLKIAGELRRKRDALALALVNSVSSWEKYSVEIADSGSKGFAERETGVFVDYLALYFETGQVLYRNLYLGEKLKQCHWPHDDPGQAVERRKAIVGLDREAYLRVVGSALDETGLASLQRELDYLFNLLTRTSERLCHVLLIGDCLYLDLIGALTVPLIEEGIQLVPTFVTDKLVSKQHREIKDLKQDFDVVFYSPLTYAFHNDFSELQYVRSAFYLPKRRTKLIDAAKRDIRSTLRLLKDKFDCSIFVHNSANIRRYDGTAFDYVKTLLTSLVRSQARAQINRWLPEYLDGVNAVARSVFLLDETRVFETSSERKLSKTIYRGGLQHPAGLGLVLAPAYRDVIVTALKLANKKVIVCDLDNTLWDGVIGEGNVKHFAERQRILLELRKKGLLLAVCSKNDPSNVHWHGGTLSEDDFVCQQINWDSKPENIRRISKKLNLKTKDFIFIDDRADERSLVAEAMPDIVTLDPEAENTWSQLALLVDLMKENTEGDRTLAYKQREQRELFLSSGTQEIDGEVRFDESEALRRLGLQLKIGFAAAKELGRVTELINRTNQFNMNGTRTSLQEVTRWHQSDRHAIWIAEAQDKFGSMGTISVAVTEKTDRGVEISAFVLSCRVFGFGMENALLNRIKRWQPNAPILGRFRETPHNGPCRRTYSENGFALEGVDWVFRTGDVVPDADWLTVKDNTKLVDASI